VIIKAGFARPLFLFLFLFPFFHYFMYQPYCEQGQDYHFLTLCLLNAYDCGFYGQKLPFPATAGAGAPGEIGILCGNMLVRAAWWLDEKFQRTISIQFSI